MTNKPPCARGPQKDRGAFPGWDSWYLPPNSPVSETLRLSWASTCYADPCLPASKMLDFVALSWCEIVGCRPEGCEFHRDRFLSKENGENCDRPGEVAPTHLLIIATQGGVRCIWGVGRSNPEGKLGIEVRKLRIQLPEWWNH